MTLTPEQKAEGWIEWNGGKEGPIKDRRTDYNVMFRDGRTSDACDGWRWTADQGSCTIIAYRIIEAHGADAAPVRPTPFPNGYDDLVFTDDGWSQTIIVDGKRPEWLRDDDVVSWTLDHGLYGYFAVKWHHKDTPAIRVRRRAPKRETGECFLIVTARNPSLEFHGYIDLIDGKPDLSTLKIAEDAL